MPHQEEITQAWENVWSVGDLDASSFFEDRFTREAYRAIRPVVAAGGRAVLEAGCGTGRFCSLIGREFPDKEIVGVDLSPKALGIARQLTASLGCRNVSFAEASIFTLPFPDNHFDVVFNEGVIQLFNPVRQPNQRDALREMVRVTKPGGRVLVAVVNLNNWPHTLYKWGLRATGRSYELNYEKSFLASELRQLMRGCGLRQIEFEGFYPSYGLYRVGYRLPRLRPLTDRLGRLVDFLEHPWIARTFGFELLAVGTK